MREIRFRAWIKKSDHIENTMLPVTDIEWDYKGKGHLLYVCVPDPYNNEHGWEVEAEDCELLQFTGLKDVNGKEIYEGDICDCVGGESAQGFHEFQDRGKVVFKDGCFGIENEKDDVFLPFFYLIEQGFEIFNHSPIYENPELLEAEE